ncbi:MAG: hypothetical protein KGV56_04115 [Gammaproteobacteria bacterium]|nr:hypothetical protein [Gammaproteobacteria bacterium]
MQKTDGQVTQEKLIEMLVNVAQHSATREELREVRDELKGDINELRAELKGDNNSLRTELKGEMNELRSELREFRKEVKSQTYWIIGSLGTILGILPNLDKIIAYFK